MRIPESELIINGDGSAFHIHMRPEDLADNVILVGDPERVHITHNCPFPRHRSRQYRHSNDRARRPCKC